MVTFLNEFKVSKYCATFRNCHLLSVSDSRLIQYKGVRLWQGKTYKAITIGKVDIMGKFAGMYHPLAYIVLDNDNTIVEVFTAEHMRRQGMAKQLLALWRHLGQAIKHSQYMTPEGRLWAANVEVVPLHTL